MNWLPVETTQAPAAEPLTLEDAKLHLRAGPDEDTLIEGLITSARQHIEKYTGTRLVTQTVKIKARELRGDEFRLPVAPIQSITSITYTDTDGATQTLATSVYETDGIDGESLEPRIALAYGQAWPAQRNKLAGAVITVQAGYEETPAPIVHAMRLLVEQWYDNRSDINVGNIVNVLPNSVTALLANFRIYGF